MGEKKLAHILAVIIMLIWGVSYLSIKVVVAEINPVLTAFYRFLIASIILFIVMKIRYPEEKILKEDRLKMALGGLTGVALYFFFENYSVLFTSASNVAILLSSIPVFTLFAQKIVFKEKMTIPKVLGAALSFVGIVIIIVSKEKISLFSKGTIGDLMALAAALTWVVYNIITSKFKGTYKSITITTYQGIWGCVFLAPSLLFSKFTIPSTKASLNLIFLAIFCSCIAYAMYIYCLEHLGATVITTYINLQPIVSLISAKLLINEIISVWQVVGSAIIILGVFLVGFGERFNLKKFEDLV
ncbi:DMT family transporter [Clostridium omnivorum]|uniref:Membrane protein n=1 Tax=Clostridium omnivorum TaxID=1604902 RepID=A0ABQ5NAA3_9CLOT|nr:DMT family transporter [Clostridium sp. E14]GLC32116.1 membrane protein [Clostridium sp. E14]